MENRQTIPAIIDEIFGLYDQYGDKDYIGEPVSQLEHMSQSAQLAIQEGFDDEVVLAAFFHDIGHICAQKNIDNNMAGFGVRRHEQIGADYLRDKGFPERVAKLVENHVQAKRYLTCVYPAYYASLSEASKETLKHQGGTMNAEEVAAFKNDPLFATSIRMRQWDELAKEINVPIIDLNEIKARVARVLTCTL